MIKLAANLSMLFQEVPFLQRFAAARAAGFRGVEFLFPYQWEPHELQTSLVENGLEQVLFNMPPGNWDAGDRGLACLPTRQQEFRDGVIEAIKYAQAMGTPRLHCMAGIAPQGADRAELLETFVGNLKFAAGECAKFGLVLMVEPINPYDVPGYFLNTSSQALEVMSAVAAENLRLQYDIYHMHRMGDDMPAVISKTIHQIGHFQIAGHPGRHEPDNGEVPYQEVLETIGRLDFSGWIGCEYLPANSTQSGLGWASALLKN